MGNYRFCPKCGVAPDNPHGCFVVSCRKCEYAWEVDTGKEVDMAVWIKALQSKFVCPGLTDEHYDDDPRVDKAMRALDTLENGQRWKRHWLTCVDKIKELRDEIEKARTKHYGLYCKWDDACKKVEKLKQRLQTAHFYGRDREAEK
jgi:hypothetical protein